MTLVDETSSDRKETGFYRSSFGVGGMRGRRPLISSARPRVPEKCGPWGMRPSCSTRLGLNCSSFSCWLNPYFSWSASPLYNTSSAVWTALGDSVISRPGACRSAAVRRKSWSSSSQLATVVETYFSTAQCVVDYFFKILLTHDVYMQDLYCLL